MARIAIQTLKDDDPSSSSSSNPHADVLLSQDLWNQLLGQLEPVMESIETGGSESSNNVNGKGKGKGSEISSVTSNGINSTRNKVSPQRIPISISRIYSPGRRRRAASSSAPIQSLVCWACLDSLPITEKDNKSKDKYSSQQQPRIRAPARLRKRYTQILGLPQCALSITPARPIQLSTIFLLASNKASYRFAQENEVHLENYLAKDGRILRQNEVLDLSADSFSSDVKNTEHESINDDAKLNNNKLAFQVTMTEPVLQGYISESTTEIIVLPPLQNSIRNPPSAAPVTTQRLPKSEQAATWHVDENFLSGDLDERSQEEHHHHHLLSDHVTAGQASSTWQSPLSSPGARSVQLDGFGAMNMNGSVVGRQGIEGTSAAAAGFSSSSSDIGSRLHKGRLIRAIACKDYIDDQDLSPFPSQDEDEHIRAYVRASDLPRLGLFSGDLVEIQGFSSSSPRLVKLYGLRSPPPLPDTDLWLLLSPILLHNMGSPPIVRLNPHKPTGNLRPTSTPTPTNTLASSLPIAKAISIARVASEHSMQKRYQPLFISALKTYFKDCKRVLRQGDLIAIPIDAGMSQFLHRETENGTSDLQEEEDDFELPLSESKPTAVAYFSVATLEAPQVGKNDHGAAPFGCVIDPSATTMIQTGLINSPVPDAYGYLGIEEVLQELQDNLQPAVDPVMTRCLDLIKASTLKHSGDLKLNLTILVKGARGSGKATLTRQIAQLSGFHLLELDCYELLGDTDTKTEGNLAARFDRAASCTPCILLLKHIEALARKSQALETGQEPTVASTLQECLKVAQEARANTGFPLILVGTTSDVEKIPLSVIGLFKEEVAIEAPAEAERLMKLQSMLSGDILSPDVSVKSLAVQTAALVATDLADLCDRARKKGAVARLLKQGLQIDECQKAGIPLTAADFASALDHARTSYSESIGAPKIPNVSWDDVGGLAKVKTEILDTIQLPLEHPELFEEGLKKRSGVLLYGPPGTGKTLLAKAVATSCSLNFFSVKGPELLNMYIGESEANVRRVFQRARDAKPCVIFFDELDSVAPKRGNQGDSGGVMDRIVSQLLAELDGMSEGKGGADVFVIGATNRPDLLDPALLRPGRFDRMLYLGVSDNHDAQRKIIEALTRKFKLDPNCDLAKVAESCPFNYTGADFYALCSDALLKAMSRKAEAVDARIADLNRTNEYKRNPLTPQYYLAELASPEEIQVTVSQLDFEQALHELVPSVSEAEMLHYKIVQQRFNPDKQIETEPKLVDRKGKGRARE